MINKKIVFVLGAGASIPFNYPSGLELKNRICSNLSMQQSREFKDIVECGYYAQNIFDFRNALFYSGQGSVDAFLELRPEFKEIGKVAIAQVLIQYEDIDSLFSPQIENNWYLYLIDKLPRDINMLSNGDVSFITFNYDRSLEQFLFMALKNSYKKSDAECGKIISSIPLIHVYGRLGYLPWQEDCEGRYSRSYNPELSSGVLKNSAKEIIILSDGVSESAEFSRAYKLLAESQLIYFIGFGYNTTNMGRLRILDALRTSVKSVYGSAFNILPADLHPIKKYFKPRSIILGEKSWDGLLFLRHYLELGVRKI